MKCAIKTLAWLYERVLRLYPRAYRQEYKGEMRSVFELAADAADRRGILSLIRLCLHELRDLPGAVIHEYWRDARRNTEEARMPAVSGAAAWGGAVNATSPFRRLSRLLAVWVTANTAAAALAIVVWMLVLLMTGSLERYWLIAAIPTFSILISTAQRGVLSYSYMLPASRGWIVASLLGWMSGSLVAKGILSWNERFPFEPLAFFILGCSIGVAQWCVIRRHSRMAVLWIPASTFQNNSRNAALSRVNGRPPARGEGYQPAINTFRPKRESITAWSARERARVERRRSPRRQQQGVDSQSHQLAQPPLLIHKDDGEHGQDKSIEGKGQACPVFTGVPDEPGEGTQRAGQQRGDQRDGDHRYPGPPAIHHAMEATVAIVTGKVERRGQIRKRPARKASQPADRQPYRDDEIHQ